MVLVAEVVGLADAGLADEEHVLVALDEGARREVKGLRVFEARASHALLELLAVAPLDLVGERAVQELDVRQVVVAGLLGAQPARA